VEVEPTATTQLSFSATCYDTLSLPLYDTQPPVRPLTNLLTCHAFDHKYAHTHIHKHTRTCTHIHTHTHANTHTHTRTHTYAHPTIYAIYFPVQPPSSLSGLPGTRLAWKEALGDLLLLDALPALTDALSAAGAPLLLRTQQHILHKRPHTVQTQPTPFQQQQQQQLHTQALNLRHPHTSSHSHQRHQLHDAPAQNGALLWHPLSGPPAGLPPTTAAQSPISMPVSMLEQASKVRSAIRGGLYS